MSKFEYVKLADAVAADIANGALKPGDRVLVQVTKDPIGHKGARLTSQVSLPGHYLVYVPNGSMSGISRKLPDTERARLKKILKEVLPDDAGVIVRTAAEGATEEQLTLDVQRLTSQWAEIAHAVDPAALIFEAPRKEQQVWFLKRFGREVNLGNIAPGDVLSLETLRLGLRSDTMETS